MEDILKDDDSFFYNINDPIIEITPKKELSSDNNRRNSSLSSPSSSEGENSQHKKKVTVNTKNNNDDEYFRVSTPSQKEIDECRAEQEGLKQIVVTDVEEPK